MLSKRRDRCSPIYYSRLSMTYIPCLIRGLVRYTYVEGASGVWQLGVLRLTPDVRASGL
jgi:hypothetical protein